MTNTCPTVSRQEQVALGVTRMAEVDEYTDRVMQDWTQKADVAHITLAHHSTPHCLSLYFGHRFCTYTEYQSLFDKRNAEMKQWKEALFTFLGIAHEQKQNTYFKRFTPDRDGYFKLMEMVNPQMRSFFFPSLPYIYTAC
jgi:hypothetical protein